MSGTSTGFGHDAAGGQSGPSGQHRVACLFATRAAAERAAEDLVTAGIARSAIEIVAQAELPEHGQATGEQSHATGGGLWDSIKRMFTGDDDAAGYYEGVNRGQSLLAVNARDAAEAEQAATVLERHDPIDLDAQEAAWRSAGWTGGIGSDVTGGTSVVGDAATYGTPSAAGYAATSGAAKPAARASASSEPAMAGRASSPSPAGATPGRDEVIQLAEESVAVGKRAVAGGRVRVRTHVVSTPIHEDVHLRDERVHVERRPADRALDASGDAFRERSVEMTESREEPVVSKTARVTEEVVIRKEADDRVERVSDTVRKTELDVDDERSTKTTGASNPARPA